LNAQLVEKADIVAALFWHRLGSSTGMAASGTIEEIEEAHSDGAYVAILRCSRPFPQTIEADQLKGLQDFLASVRPKSLMLDYESDADLARHIDTILSHAVTRDTTRAEAAVEKPTADADVWPRIESSERVKTDSKSRVKTDRRWNLVLANTGAEPARNVRYHLEAENEGDHLPMDPDGDRRLEVLAPYGEASYLLILHMGVAPQVRCVVSWEGADGEHHENTATLRLF
jgi:hypothetical protein